MHNNLSKHFEIFLHSELNNNVKDTINNQATICQFKKNAIVIFENENVDSIYYINEGIVRGYYLDCEGREVTKCFSYKNQIFGSECFRTKKKSTFFVETITDCNVIKISYSCIEQIIKMDQNISKYIQNLYYKELAKLEEKNRDILISTKETCYINFCEEYKDVVDQIPMKYIASYLGIKPGSLSRIRKNLMIRSQK